MRILTWLVATIPILAFGQVGVGTSAPDPSAALDVTSSSKGFLPPRMTESERTSISSPATGLIVYQTDGTKGLYVYSGSAWIPQASWYTNSASPSSSFIFVTPSGVTSDAQSNFGIGSNSLNSLTSGDNNTSFGYDAAKSITSNGNNTAIGSSALSATTGTGNTAIGKSSGTTNVSGSYNTFLGTSADATANNLSNATALGYGAEVTTSNGIQLGNSNVTQVTTYGSIGVGTTAPTSNAALEIVSTSKGLMLPRLTTTQRSSITTPSSGLLIFNSTTGKAQVYTPNQSTLLDISSANNSAYRVSSSENQKHTFTAPSSESLSAIQITVYQVETSGSVTASVYSGSGTGGTLLGSASASISSTGAATFNIGTAIPLTSGSTYTIHLTSTGSTSILFYGDTGNPYSGGGLLNNSGNVLAWDLDITLFASGTWTDLH